MIFQANNVSQTMSILKDTIQRSNLSLIKDRYLLAGWNDNIGFTFELYIKE
jgi:hypothetical protein